MRRIIVWFEALVLVGGGLIGGTVSPAGALEDAIIAIVNDDVITLRDLKGYLNSIYSQMRLEGVPDEEIKTTMSDLESRGVERLIEDKLLLSEAKRRDIKSNSELVDRRVAEIRSRYKTESEFVNALLSEGASISELKEKIRDQLMTRFLVEQEIRSKIFVNPQEVNDFYKDHFEQFKREERADVASIFIPNDGDKEAARKKAEDVLAQIHDGKDFIVLVKENSQRPSLGMVEKGKFLEEIETIVFALKESGVSDVVAVEDGFYIFKLKKHFPAEMSSLDEVKDKVTARIFEQKFRQRFVEWVDKLKKNAYIEIKR